MVVCVVIYRLLLIVCCDVGWVEVVNNCLIVGDFFWFWGVDLCYEIFDGGVIDFLLCEVF